MKCYAALIEFPILGNAFSGVLRSGNLLLFNLVFCVDFDLVQYFIHSVTCRRYFWAENV